MSQSLSFDGAACAVTMPAPALVRYSAAVTSALASVEALIAATTWAAVLVTTPAASVAAWTVIAFPLTVTLSALLAPSLTICAVRLLPPSWPQASAVRTTALACSAAAGALVEPVYGVVMPMTVCDLRW